MTTILSVAHLPEWRKQFVLAYYRLVPYLIDRMPWFASKRLMNLFFGRVVYFDLMHANRALHPLYPVCNVVCLK